MRYKQALIIGALMTNAMVTSHAGAAEASRPYVRMAELAIDPAQLDAFTAAIKEVQSVSVSTEPGCLVLYAVADNQNPAEIKVFEIYQDVDAYRAHVQTPHFQKFRAVTDNMVKSRTLMDMIPVSLAAKAK